MLRPFCFYCQLCSDRCVKNKKARHWEEKPENSRQEDLFDPDPNTISETSNSSALCDVSNDNGSVGTVGKLLKRKVLSFHQ